MLPSYVVLDLETTGGSAVGDRVTDIAAVRVDHGTETARWSTLVNPGVPIPGFIQSLTGIDDAMVVDAPSFKSVADRLLALLEGSVLVAHNAGFDHGFLRGEFARLGHDLRVPSLCTVRLSRRLYPEFKSHGLDALIQRHQLHTDARHRAMGDVDMVLAWLTQVRTQMGEPRLHEAALALLQPPMGLPVLLETQVDNIPDSPGVYLLHGEGPVPLFIGSAKHLRQRVTAQLQSASRSSRERGIVANTRRIEWRPAAGELGALLLAKRLIADLQPTYGRSGTAAPIDMRALHPWPHVGAVGLREHDADTGRSDVHIFLQWCHVASVQDDHELQAALDAMAKHQTGSGFDIDVYRLLVKRLLGGQRDASAVVVLPQLAHGDAA